MTDARINAADDQAGVDHALARKVSVAAAAERMAWDTRSRRMVTIYLPLACFVLILLFPFYWMTVTAFKPNAELYDFKTNNPF